LRHKLKFQRLNGSYAVVRFDANAAIPDWAMQGEFTSITRTADELSIVCPVENLATQLESAQPWMCLKLQGPFPFSQTGVLLSLIEPLSGNSVPIFVISTYDTDYVLIQEEFSQEALVLLHKAGHELQASD
jgi:uncharacterized protein